MKRSGILASILVVLTIGTSLVYADTVRYSEPGLHVQVNAEDGQVDAYVESNHLTLEYDSVSYSPAFIKDGFGNYYEDPLSGEVSFYFSGSVASPTELVPWVSNYLSVQKPNFNLTESISSSVRFGWGEDSDQLWTDASAYFLGNFRVEGSVRSTYREYYDSYHGSDRWSFNASIPISWDSKVGLPKGITVPVVSSVPEPASLALTGLGCLCLFHCRRRGK